MENRLIALETRLAHHERLTEDLSEMILQQGRSIDRLLLEIDRLQTRLDDLACQSPQPDRPPPHY